MKKNIMLVAAMVAFGTIVFAQESKDIKRVNPAVKMKQELSLSDEQFKSIQQIEEKYKTQRSEIHAERKNIEQKRREESKQIAENREREIKAVLTPEQQAQWEAKKEERRKEFASKKEGQPKFDRKPHHGKHSRGKSMHARGHESWKGIDGITADQEKQLKEVSKAKFDKFKASKESGVKLTDAEIKKVNDDHDAAVKKILTKDQFKKWEELKKERAAKLEKWNDKGGEPTKSAPKNGKDKKGKNK